MIFLKHKLVSTFEPENILMHCKDKTIIHDSNVPLQSFSIATFLLKFFSFSFRFSILLIKVMKMHKREIFKNPNFLIPMILRQQSKLRALKQTVP